MSDGLWKGRHSGLQGRRKNKEREERNTFSSAEEGEKQDAKLLSKDRTPLLGIRKRSLRGFSDRELRPDFLKDSVSENCFLSFLLSHIRSP
ncbi:hypothetical protein AVEN_172344-1 [Araneus ventricosus]|uniref:Uncharacterized protein n=1 Tax=Araneus ventricosus TaxID=182803 RepID=A0A4Y2E4N7_ARAVE|nr:hypothetical protein AVEN_172344-1 [Araneus ventricosus]